MKKKALALAMAAGLVLTASATTANAQVQLKDGSTTAGWADTTVADLLPAGTSIDDINTYTLTLTFDTELAGEENFLVVMQNTVDWAWSQVSVGPSTEALDYQGNPYNMGYVVVDANTVAVNFENDGLMKIMTENDKLAVGDWGEYVVTNVTMTVNSPVEAAAPAEDVEAPAEDVTVEAPADDAAAEAPAELPKTGLVSGAVFFAAGALVTAAGAVVAKKKED